MDQICPDCNERSLKFFNGRYSKRCLICANEKIKDRNKERNKIRAKTKTCPMCLKEFYNFHGSQIYCRNPCGEVKVSEVERWLNKKTK